MRVAVVAHNARRVGGAEAYVGTIVPALERAGFELATWFERADGPGEPVFPAGAPRPSWTAGPAVADALGALAAWRPDLLFVHGLQSIEAERSIVAIAPAVAFAHSYYGTCITGSKSHAFPRPAPCSRTFGPACLARFYPRRCGGLSPLTMAAQFRLQRGRLAPLDSYARIAVASRHMAREYERHGLAAKVRVIGLPAPPSADSREARSSDAESRLLYLGRLERTKGVPLLLESVAMAARAMDRTLFLDIAGEGSQRAQLERRAARLAAARRNLTIRFHGHLAAADCERLIGASDVLLVPSCWPEPFGLVGLEAASRGVPAIAFDVGGIRDWLVDGRTGVLVAGVPDARGFAQAIVRCLADPAALQKMGQRARDHSRQFALERHLERITAVFAEVTPAARTVGSP